MMMMMMMMMTTTTMMMMMIIIIIITGIIPNESHERLKILNLYPALYNLMQKAVKLITCRIVTKFLAEL
jgi:hypothetical protein